MTDHSLPAVFSPTARAPRVSRGFWSGVGERLLSDRIVMTCVVILLVVTLMTIFAPWVAPADPFKTSIARRLKPIGATGYILGTDELGRDLLSRMIWGGRVSLLMGFLPVCIATFIGGFLGILAGFAAGRTNTAIMRTMDVFYAFPSVLLAVGISGAIGGGIVNGLLSLTLVFIPPVARVAESVTVQIRGRDYVEAARATGARADQILFGHVLPNVTGPILVYASGLISVSIVIAAGLSFLGLGVSPPTAEWGSMLSSLRQSIYVAPFNAVVPGLMILVTSLCFNLISDGVRNAMDTRP
jgi:peptide/nickel transport system permease protein